ncbi:calcium/sodium antiporter [Alkalicoccus chagannorensis]|uniref:calcium/sodium antiporter n=1 Tax=Alkalicoccus chagannorensis TaxID=427072 RepID=UPI00047B6434|nr:calcium/sodium antiporter [Alkalicoccus chagannorensis]
MMYLLLAVGFVLLIIGADLFVRGASDTAARFRIPPMLIGLTVVAFGTSSPEAAVSIMAAFGGEPDVAVGNVIGSNVVNITLIAGLTAVVTALVVKEAVIRKEIPFTILAGVVLLVMMLDMPLHDTEAMISRSDGLLLLLFFTVFLAYVLESARQHRLTTTAEPVAGSWTKSLLFMGLGIVLLVAGGEALVRGAIGAAEAFGMSSTLAGLTIAAVGTSLPELAASLIAAWRKETDMAVGNLVGSNIFNIFFVLGVSAVITPLPVQRYLVSDIVLLLAVSGLLLLFTMTGRRLSRKEGILLALVYIVYLIFIILRN